MVEMKFYETKDFKNLCLEWRKKLEEHGFIDHEDAHENLNQYDRRNILFDNRQVILEFYLKLDKYLHTADIPPLHRQILELYTQGTYITEISTKCDISYRWTTKILRKYKDLLLK